MKIEQATVAVVGAGLMGAQVAWACRQRGLDVVVLEADDVASGASVVRAEPVFVPEEIQALTHLAPWLVREVPWEKQLTAALHTGTCLKGFLGPLPPGLGSAGVVDTNRLTARSLATASDDGARLYCGEFVTDVEIKNDGYRLVASSLKVDCRVVVDATGAEGIAGSFRCGVPNVVSENRQWIQLDQSADRLITFDGGSADRSWLIVPGLSCSWLMFPRERPVEESQRGALSERSVSIGWRSRTAVVSRTGYFLAPGRRVGETVAVAQELAAAVTSLVGESREPRKLPLVPAGHGLDGVALSERHRIPLWIAERLFMRHGDLAADMLAAIGPREVSLVCPCQGVLTGELRHAIRREHVTTLEAAQRRTGLGEGPCAGARCAHRASELLVEAGVLEPEAMCSHADAYIWSRAGAGLVTTKTTVRQREWLAMARAYRGQ